MDAKDRSEATIRQRDAKLARRLGEALDQMNPHVAKKCPDAEVIAAYSERALGADELAECEDHFATCGRCRNILRVLAAASDAPLAENEVAQLGQRISATRDPIEISAGSAQLPRTNAKVWSARWLAPAFGIAAVLLFWFVIRPSWRTLNRNDSPTLVAQAPPQEMIGPAPVAVDRAQKIAPAPESPAAKTASPNSIPQPSADESLKSNEANRDFAPTDRLEKSFSGEKKEPSLPAREDQTNAKAAPPPPPPPPQSAVSSAVNSAAPMAKTQAQMNSSASARPLPRAPNPAEADATLSAAQSVTVTEAAPAAEGANKPAAAPQRQQLSTDAPLNGRNFQGLGQLRVGRAKLLLLKPLLGVSMWRAGIGGVIERSTDAGKTWMPQTSPSKEDWLAGAAISDSVCWIAGRNGAIARTTDGEHWELIAPPSQSARQNGKMPDWTGITALDAQTATVTSSEGNKFVTADGGKTWRQP